MRRFLAGLLCISIMSIGTYAMGGLAKKAPFVIMVKTMTQAAAAALAAATNLPVHYVNTADGLAYYVTAAGVHYNLTGTTGGSGATTFAGNDGTDAVAGTIGEAPGGVFIVGTQGINITGSAGNTLYVSADGVHTQVSAYAVGGVIAYFFAGVTGPSRTFLNEFDAMAQNSPYYVLSNSPTSVTISSGISVPGVTIYHNPTFDKTPLFISTDQDGISGITVNATAHNAKIGIAIVNDSATWRIVNDGADGGTLKFYKANTVSAEMDTASFSAPAITSTGNIIGTSVYSYDTSGVDGIGGLYLYTKAIGGNYVLIKIPGDGALLNDYTLTLPVTGGVSNQALLTDANGQLTFGNPTAVETDATALKALADHNAPLAITGASLWGGASAFMVSAVSPCAIAVSFGEARTGDSVFVVAPYQFALTGVSVIGFMNATVSVSVWMAPTNEVIPNTAVGDYALISASGTGTSVYTNSGTTVVPYLRVLMFEIKSIATAGASNWLVQLMGRRRP